MKWCICWLIVYGISTSSAFAENGEYKTITAISLPAIPTCMRFSPDGKHLAIAMDRGDSGSHVLLGTAEGKEYTAFVRRPLGLMGLAFSPDAKNLATTWADGDVRLYDLSSKHERLRIVARMPPGRYASCLVFAPDGKVLALGLEHSGVIRLCDTVTGEVIGDLDGRRRDWLGDATITVLAFSPDGRLLASGAADSCVRVWNVSNGEELFSFAKRSGPKVWQLSTLQFSRDGRMLATLGPDGQIWLFEVFSGNIRAKCAGEAFLYGGGEVERFSTISGQERQLAVSPSGKLLAKLTIERKSGAIACKNEVIARVARQVRQPAAKEVSKAQQDFIQDLSSDDATVAYQAVLGLAACHTAVADIAQKLRKVHSTFRLRAESIRKLTTTLGDDSFQVRERVANQLEEIAWFDLAILRETLVRTHSDEIRARIKAVLTNYRKLPIPEDIRFLHRAIEALELTGTSEAKASLQHVSDFFPEDFATIANESIRRLTRERMTTAK